MPCNSVNTNSGIMQGEQGKVRDDCKPEFAGQQRYLEMNNVLIYANQVRFLPDKFGNESIKRTSVVLNKQFDPHKPSWLDTVIQFNELQDETEFLQYG